MTMLHRVERARAGDRDTLLALLLKAFRHHNPTHPLFEDLYPDLFPPTDAAMMRHFLIRDDAGLPVSCVGLYPIDVQLGPARIRTAGVGQVATDPAQRGKGMMHALMTRVQEELASAPVSVAWLGGRHDRYSRYGWEWGGNPLHISLDARSVGPAPGGWKVQTWAETDVPFARIWALREARPVRGLCGEAEWRLKMRRGGAETWFAKKGDRAAFAVLNPGWRSVQEWGGDSEGLFALLAHATQTAPLSVQVHPELEPEMELFRRHATGAGVGMTMLSASNLETLAADYEPILRDRLPAGCSIRLAIQENGRSASAVTLGRGIPGGRHVELAMDRCRMTAFLFGPVRPSHTAGLTDEARWVDQVFPLPFMMPRLFSV